MIKISIKRQVAPALAAGLILAGNAGCAGLDAGKAEAAEAAAVKAPSPEENGRKLLEAFQANDAATFIGQLPPELQKQFDEQAFVTARRSLAEKLGEPVSFSYLTTEEHPYLTVSLWKVRFKRQSSAGKDIFQEAVFRVIASLRDGKYTVISFNFL